MSDLADLVRDYGDWLEAEAERVPNEPRFRAQRVGIRVARAKFRPIRELLRPYHCGGPQTGQPRPHVACSCSRRRERRKSGALRLEVQQLADEVVYAEHDGRLAQAQSFRDQVARLVGGVRNADYHVMEARDRLKEMSRDGVATRLHEGHARDRRAQS